MSSSAKESGGVCNARAGQCVSGVTVLSGGGTAGGVSGDDRNAVHPAIEVKAGEG
jgi:hypothetical protein